MKASGSESKGNTPDNQSNRVIPGAAKKRDKVNPVWSLERKGSHGDWSDDSEMERLIEQECKAGEECKEDR